MQNETTAAQEAIGRRLRKLELQGFKSFPDKTVIEFKDGITAIVGPNGSGKSNIADALRWVLGETSTKTLRGAKMEDVIFNGTRERKAMGFAEVAIYLDNSDRMFDLDYAEIAVARRFYRSGESEYRLNKTPVRLKDIRELFRDTGLGRDGYSVIGQGMITEIIKAKPTDRRFLFEEAAGIAGLKFKKEESARRLDQTQENLVRIGDIVSELAERIPSLEEKSRKARRYLDYSGEKKDLELFVWQKQVEKYTEDLGKASVVKKTFDDQLNASAEYFARAEERETKQNKEIQDLTVEMDRQRTVQTETEGQMASADAEIQVLENEIEHLCAEQNRLEKEDAQRCAARELLEQEKKQTEERLNKSGQTVRDLEQKISELYGERDASRKTEQEFTSQADQAAEETARLTGELTALQIRKAAAAQAQEEVRAKTEELDLDGADAEEKRRSLEKARQESRTEAEKYTSILNDNRNKLEGYRLRYENRKEQAEKKDAALQSVRIELSKKQSRLQLLSDMEKHYEGFNFAVRTVMQEAQRGVLKGEMQTVASVISVDPKFAAAVEIALGAGIQNIITEDEAGAKHAMQLLKSKNAGRATFLPLTSVRGNRLSENGLKQEPGYIGLGCDLIAYDKKYEPAMVFLLGRTAIAEDIDTALSISRKNNRAFRIVTLDGQVVNAGGSMTGGSLSKNTGILTRRNEIDLLTEEIGKDEEQLKQEEIRLKEWKEEVGRAAGMIDQINAQSAQAQQMRAKAQAEYDSYTKYLQDVEAEAETRRAQKETLLRRTEELTAEETELSQKEALLTDRIASRERSAKDTEDRIAQIRKNQADLAEKLHAVQLDILAENKTAEQNRATLSDLTHRIEEYGKGKEEISAQQKENREKTEAAQNAIRAARQRKEDAKQTVRAIGDAIRALGEKRNAAEAERNRMRTEEKEMYETREQLTRESERTQAKINQLTEANNAVLARLWDEYELTLSEVTEMRLSFELPFAKKRTEELKEKIRALGHVDVSSIEEYTAVKQRYDSLQAQFEDLSGSKAELEKMIASLEKEMAAIFEEQLKTINAAFSETFREMFNGGDAKLKLEEPDNILESGVEIFAAPPGKIIKNLVSLSGGEQALTAIALYFAILKIKPSPFCLLDEIEAALDDVNVVRYAAYLHRLSDKTQFVTITHRRGTMEEADKLYGVTMVEKGISRVLAIDVDEISKMNLETT